jgi:acyl-CoA thioesterase-1
LRRLDWLLRQPVLVMVLELGANDMLRGQSVEAMSENLQSIIDRLSDEHPSASVVVAGMRAAPNLGRSYTEAFDASFLALATHNDAVLVPFLLAGVAGEPGLNLPDGIHPNAEGHRIVADTVWAVLQPLLVGTTAGP